MDERAAVLKGYSQRLASEEKGMGAEAAQICTMDPFDPELLARVPEPVAARDFGCGNPSKYARKGEVVLDLGCGGGKACYVMAQIVGAEGRVIGIDMNRDMLALAKAHVMPFADRLGYRNLDFFLAQAEDLATDINCIDRLVARRNLKSAEDLFALQTEIRQNALSEPLIADCSVDLVVSNCVLNLVAMERKHRAIQEIWRVLKPGGRIALSDNVADRRISDDARNDEELWTACYAGAWQEQDFLQALEGAGFAGLHVEQRLRLSENALQDVTFHAITVTGYKPETGGNPHAARHVYYPGPWREVIDDSGLRLRRGMPVPVTEDQSRMLHLGCFSKELLFPEENGHRVSPSDVTEG